MSENTICRRSQLSGLLSFRAAKKPFISLKNQKVRIEFEKAHRHWAINDWKRLLWSNQSKYNLKGPDGNLKVHRPNHMNAKEYQGILESNFLSFHDTLADKNLVFQQDNAKVHIGNSLNQSRVV